MQNQKQIQEQQPCLGGCVLLGAKGGGNGMANTTIMGSASHQVKLSATDGSTTTCSALTTLQQQQQQHHRYNLRSSTSNVSSPVRRRHPSGRTGKIVGDKLPRELRELSEGWWTTVVGAQPLAKLAKPIPLLPITTTTVIHRDTGPTTRAQAAAAVRAMETATIGQALPFGRLPPPQRPPHRPQGLENPAIAGFLGGLKLLQEQQQRLLATKQQNWYTTRTTITDIVGADGCPPGTGTGILLADEEAMDCGVVGGGEGHDGCGCRCGWECPVEEEDDGKNDENRRSTRGRPRVGTTTLNAWDNDDADSGVGSSKSGTQGIDFDDDDLIFDIEL